MVLHSQPPHRTRLFQNKMKMLHKQQPQQGRVLRSQTGERNTMPSIIVIEMIALILSLGLLVLSLIGILLNVIHQVLREIRAELWLMNACSEVLREREPRHR